MSKTYSMEIQKVNVDVYTEYIRECDGSFFKHNIVVLAQFHKITQYKNCFW